MLQRTSTDSNATGSQQPFVKRGRGRPRKVQAHPVMYFTSDDRVKAEVDDEPNMDDSIAAMNALLASGDAMDDSITVSAIRGEVTLQEEPSSEVSN